MLARDTGQCRDGILASMTRKIAISVADELLDAVDEASDTVGMSRSRFFAEAARTYLVERRRQREVSTYVDSYRDDPETDEELASTNAFLGRSFKGS